MACMWTGYAVIMWLIAADPHRYAPILNVLCVGAVVGGLCRVHTAMVYGLPKALLAKSVVIGAVGLEFVVPVLLAMYWRQGRRKEEEEERECLAQGTG